MIVICEECGKNYRIDPETIKASEARFKCKRCGHQIVARKPQVSESAPSPETAPAHSGRIDAEKDRTPAPGPEGKSPQKKAIDASFSRSPKIRFGLTAKLFIMMIIISLVPLIMFWGITLKQTKDRIRYEARKNTGQQFVKTARNLDEWFYERARMIRSLPGIPEILSMQADQQRPIITAFQATHPDLDPIFSVDMTGAVICASSSSPFSERLARKYITPKTLDDALVLTTVIDKDPLKTGLLLTAPIKRGALQVGVLSGFISIRNISGRLLTAESGGAAFALILREKNSVIVYPADSAIHKSGKGNWQPLSLKFRNGQNGISTFTDGAGKSNLAYVAKTSFGWGIAVQTREADAFSMMDQLMSYAYLLLIITVVFIFVIAWFSGRALSRPIIKLTEAADRISVGELDMEIRTRRKDEIGDLAEAIARMQDSIRLSIERLRRRR